MTTERDKMIEAWKPIPGTAGKYEVSDQGRVRSLYHSVGNGAVAKRKTPLIMKQSLFRGQYFKVGIIRIGKAITVSVHRLVLESFKGEAPKGMHCAHLNGNPKDNRLENLAWVTPKENEGHKRLHGTHAEGARAPTAKLTRRQVVEILNAYGKGGVGYKTLAKKYGVCAHAIADIIKGKTWLDVERPQITINNPDPLSHPIVKEMAEAIDKFIEGEYPVIHAPNCIRNNSVFGSECDCGVSESLKSIRESQEKYRAAVSAKEGK